MCCSSETVSEVRYIVQRILVPVIVVIGLPGNLVSIYVLTRKSMRCTTHIYLTGLAVMDIVYLILAFLLSLKHYVYVQEHWSCYWIIYGVLVWLIDACAYSSIYIAVCFTVERFMVIYGPIRSRRFCTEELVKYVIRFIVIFCFASTISTAFEHTYTTETSLIDDQGKPCNLSLYQNPLDRIPESFLSSMVATNGDNESVNYTYMPVHESDTFDPFILPDVRTEPDVMANQSTKKRHLTLDSAETEAPDAYGFSLLNCRNVTRYRYAMTELGLSRSYMQFWNLLTLTLFVLLPLVLLLVFNSLLIFLLRRSKNIRTNLTNASSMRRNPNSSRSRTKSISQDNRITMTLICVVLVFIICQLPWAIYLICLQYKEIEPNLQTVLGNIFNFLTGINAAANFFLYCVLSDKYRSSVRLLFKGHPTGPTRTMTMTTYAGSRRLRTDVTHPCT